MVLELHVWGPAFGLPSIDAQCLATIAYFTQTVPKTEWVLVASSDPAVCPTQELPAVKNGSLWVSRFRNIVDYLRKYSDGEWNLDADLDKKQQADCFAFSSFVESHGQPLVDLSLYVSSENYTTATRGAYSEILQWPGQWITPPKLRAVAKLRSEHLGLSSLDLDSADLPETASEGPRAVQIPRSLVTRPKETVSSFFSKAANRSQFRLSTIASQFHEPLQELLGGAEYFFTSTSPSSLDCLVLGYLALALHPRLPHEWLRDSLTEKFSDLRYFTETFGRQCFGPVVTVRDAFLQTSVDHNEPKGKTVDASLPWKAPEQASIAVMGSTILENMADSTPVLREMRAHSRMQQASKNPHLDEEESRSLEKIAKQGRNETYSQIAFAVVSVSAFVGYLFHEGLISVRRSDEENQTEKRDFGDAGSLLGI